MPEVYREFIICDLTTETEDGRFKARAAVIALAANSTRFQRFLDFETFDSKAQAIARAQGGATVWIDEEHGYVPFALPRPR